MCAKHAQNCNNRHIRSSAHDASNNLHVHNDRASALTDQPNVIMRIRFPQSSNAPQSARPFVPRHDAVPSVNVACKAGQALTVSTAMSNVYLSVPHCNA